MAMQEDPLMWWASRTLTPATLPPMTSFPHVLSFRTGNEKVWMVTTRSLLATAELGLRRICPHAPDLDLGASVTVLMRVSRPADDQREEFLHMFVTNSMDLAVDVLSCFMFAGGMQVRVLAKVYTTHGFAARRVQLRGGVVFYPVRLRNSDMLCDIPIPPATPLNFFIDLAQPGQKMTFSRVVCSQCPIVFYAPHCDTVIWASLKHDSLLRRTLEQTIFLHVPEMLNLVRGFLVKFALVFLTKTTRVEYADIFILDSMAETMAGIGATLLAKHPYQDGGFLLGMETVFGDVELWRQFGNHRVFQKV